MENKKTKILYAVIALLVVIIAVLAWQLVVTKTTVKTIIVEKNQVKEKNTELQQELDSVLLEYTTIKEQYGSLNKKLADQDSTIQKYAKDIQKLIASQADYSRIKKKLEYLRNITQGYINRVDSLYRENKVLKDENVKIKANYEEEQQKVVQLSKDKDELNTKVNLASTLKAYKINGSGIRLKKGKDEIVVKARKSEKLKVCFVLGENLIAAPGNKTVYVRIARPDGLILTQSNDETYAFTTTDGNKLQFTTKQVVNYQNKEMDICLYWQQTGEFDAGTYNVTVYIDGFFLGESSFVLN